jgi:hypothetical protein
VVALNEDMGRCIYCHSVVTKTEESCYVCGDSVPKQAKAAVVQRQPVSPLTNLVFLAGLAYTAYGFFGPHKLPLPVTVAISCSLLLIRILAQRMAGRKIDPHR